MDYYTVYMHRNKFNHKVYVGITSTTVYRRWCNGSGYKHNKYFWRAIQKYGWDKGFEHYIIYDYLSKEEAEYLESELIKTFNSTNHKYGYNIASGGGIYGKHSEETKRKISKDHKGKYDGCKNPMYGKHHTIETRKKMSKNRFKRPIFQIDIKTNKIIKEFESANQASRETNIRQGNISNVCCGRSKSAGGYKWRYADFNFKE